VADETPPITISPHYHHDVAFVDGHAYCETCHVHMTDKDVSRLERHTRIVAEDELRAQDSTIKALKLELEHEQERRRKAEAVQRIVYSAQAIEGHAQHIFTHLVGVATATIGASPRNNADMTAVFQGAAAWARQAAGIWAASAPTPPGEP